MEENIIIRKLKFYCSHSHLHGLKYVESDERGILVRFLWAIIFITYCVLMTLVFISCARSYQEDSISFLTETTYLDWNTTFPSVSVCQQSGVDISIIKDKFDERDNIATLEFFITDLLFFSGSCYACQTQCYTCPELNISSIVEKLRKPCSSVFSQCRWNNIEFDCCEAFLPMETEYGVCFSVNSLHTVAKSENKLLRDFNMNRKTGIGELFIQTQEDVRVAYKTYNPVYFHAPEDVPFINAESHYMKDIAIGESYEVIFNVVEIANDNKVIHVPVHKRKCRYPWEVPANLKVHRFYSYSTCLVQCHADNHFKLCNCTHHHMPYYNKRGYCNIDGLRCLSDNVETLNRLHSRGSSKPGLDCDCYPSCTEPEYNVVLSQRVYNESSGFKIKLHSLPTSRFKRVVVKDNLDLVVSIGGAAGLFIGASLQTILEIIYLLYIRK